MKLLDQKEVSPLQHLCDDLSKACTNVQAAGALSLDVYGRVAGWFSDVSVDRLLPILAAPVAANTRASQLAATVRNMFDAVVTVSNKGLSDEDALANLAPTLDPLWRNLFSLQAPLLNSVHLSYLSTTAAYRQKRLARFGRLVNMKSPEILAFARSDRRMHETISNLGFAMADFSISN